MFALSRSGEVSTTPEADRTEPRLAEPVGFGSVVHFKGFEHDDRVGEVDLVSADKRSSTASSISPAGRRASSTLRFLAKASHDTGACTSLNEGIPSSPALRTSGRATGNRVSGGRITSQATSVWVPPVVTAPAGVGDMEVGGRVSRAGHRPAASASRCRGAKANIETGEGSGGGMRTDRPLPKSSQGRGRRPDRPDTIGTRALTSRHCNRRQKLGVAPCSAVRSFTLVTTYPHRPVPTPGSDRSPSRSAPRYHGIAQCSGEPQQ